jgi:DNA-binding transcriptional MerR regulator
MKKYTIGEVSRILDLKDYVIRYWEQEVPFFSGEKSLTGRRLYSEKDLQVLFRLKHLLYDKKYTIEGAVKQIWDDINSSQVDLTSEIAAIRSELIECLSVVRKEEDQAG